MKGFAYRRVKNDERDATDLGDLLRRGRLPEAWIAPPEIRELREITRYRLKLVGIRTSCKDQVHGVLAKLGVEVTSASSAASSLGARAASKATASCTYRQAVVVPASNPAASPAKVSAVRRCTRASRACCPQLSLRSGDRFC